MKIDKSLILMMGICFIAEPFFLQLNNILLFTESKILGVKSHFFLTGYGTACNGVNDRFDAAIIYCASTYNALLFSLVGYFLTKYGTSRNASGWILLGALLFYSALHQTLNFWVPNFIFHFEDFFPIGSDVPSIYLVTTVANIILTFVYLFLAYRIVFKMWDKPFRIAIFTFGLIATIAGGLVLYFVIGRSFPYFIHYFS